MLGVAGFRSGVAVVDNGREGAADLTTVALEEAAFLGVVAGVEPGCAARTMVADCELDRLSGGNPLSSPGLWLLPVGIFWVTPGWGAFNSPKEAEASTRSWFDDGASWVWGKAFGFVSPRSELLGLSLGPEDSWCVSEWDIAMDDSNGGG